METIKVYSPIEDKKIKKDVNNSPIWKKAYHKEDYGKAISSENAVLFEYTVKFEHTNPIQVTKVRKVF